MEGGVNPGWLLDDFTSYGGGPSSRGRRSLIRGEGFVTRISSNIRPQDPGGGAAWLATPREREKMDVLNSPDVSVVEPQSVPTRISVVLVEEAKSGGAHRVGCSLVDQDLRLLAGMVTVCEDSHLSPSAEETLSSPDLAGKLFPVVPAGIPLPAGHVGPVGPCGMISPYDLTSLGLVGPNPGPVGPCGITSPSDLTSSGPVGLITDSVGPVGPYVTHGSVGAYGMLSPCDSDQLDADGRWARMLHVARWARMGCYPRVTPTLTLISQWLMAR